MFKKNHNSTARMVRRDQGTSLYAVAAQQLLQAEKADEIDSMMGFDRYIPVETQAGNDRVGWLTNMHPVVIALDKIEGGNRSNGNGDGGGQDDNYNNGSNGNVNAIAGVDFYFLDEEGGSFKSTINYDPYFFVLVTDDSMCNEVEEYLKKLLETCLKSISVISKEDLAMDNHLLGLRKTVIKLEFINNNHLFEARKLLRPILQDNENTQQQRNIYDHTSNNNILDAKRYIEDIREYDVPYHVRVSIDKNVRVGKWYKISPKGFIEMTEKVAFADPVVLAFDIETTKAPLKFPDASVDQIMMISYMIDGEGFLITNREIISEDIDDFEYTPKPEYPGLFTIFNEQDELELLKRFFDHIREVRPTVISTFNGDFFDWPFVETRSKIHGLNMYDEIGFAPDAEGEYKSSYCSHMDCFRWVKRDSYLPQGSQGLKAVTQAKLGYNPIELDPELMTPYAYEKPQLLSEYSVSDAVATYYLYMKYVHPFIFSLCTIIPLNPDEVLRKGTGTLCEMLLMVQAYEHEILLPNKHTDPIERFYDGHLLETETYVGGHVEALQAGVFRSDIEYPFDIDPTAIDELIDDLPHALKFAVEVENNAKMDDVTNFKDIQEKITELLLELKTNNKRREKPLIYHVDVASMYPNIMTTNRLQPDSIKTERDCASCDFNRPGKTCARKLKWAWRGEFYPAKMDEYNMIKRALQNETFPNKNKFSKNQILTFDQLSYTDQVAHIKKRLSEYSRKVYHRIKVSEVVEREAIVCQRENPFYVNTVRSFRDRRYEFKGLAKTWKGKISKIDKSDKHGRDEAKKMVVLYDSLQLAHKVILNSFYGYVMRKGSRWYSMEMAGITCLTGATIIQMARSLVERVGTPLELDTDGIWCTLPKSFPENYFFELKNGKKMFLSYPCSMLNYRVHKKFTNDQYQTLVDPVKFKYETHADNSIFFEVDGPYKAMILPTSKEEGKGIKKRYAVFNEDGSLAELKGFELKRRGELQLIKNFQSDIFKVFLEGDSLETCYGAVANVADRWLDVLDTKGAMLEDEDLIELICENRSMSKTLAEYEGQKSTSITTAKRLGEFLGKDMVKDKGLQCKYIIANRPPNAPVTERAIPVAIFSADLAIKRSFLRRWTSDQLLDNFDIRYILDWAYYRERLSSTIQKIITIPAALQNVENPVPRVEHPEWLQKKIRVMNDKFKQTSLTKFFSSTKEAPKSGKVKDIEDLFTTEDSEEFKQALEKQRKTARVSKMGKRKNRQADEVESLVLPLEMPSMTEDYSAWLKYQKIKWKIQARDRKRRTQVFGNSNRTSNRSTLGSLVRKQADSYSNFVWEILQYKASNTPGALDVFVLMNGKIQTLTFKIPKSVYIKMKNDDIPIDKVQNFLFEKVNMVLPNNPKIKSSDNIYKLTLPESEYFIAKEKPSSILNDDNILGVFESAITSTQKAVLELGSSVSFTSNAVGSLGKGLQNGFDMKNLTMTDNDRYMAKFNNDVVYLSHTVTNIGYTFYTLFKSWDEIIRVFTLKPSNHANDLSATLVKNIYKQLYERKKEKLNKIITFMEDPIIEFDSFTDIDKLNRHINKALLVIKEERSQQFIVILQSPNNQQILSSIKNLRHSPVIELFSTTLDLPQLNWQQQLSTKLMSQILSCGNWISHMIKVAQFSNIPICNLQLNNIDYVIDILYARQMKHENIILWWNENGPLPDLGGWEKAFDPNVSNIMHDLTFPDINTPSIYDQTVLEVQLRNLSVNTVLASTLINEAEGTDLADSTVIATDDNLNVTSVSSFVQDSFNIDALNVLKNLLKEWWDKALDENFTADLLVNSFMNWVQNPKSNLFNGLLRYHVHNLAKKAFLQLINEFTNLGSTVVYADRNKLLIKTNKYTPENCYAYSEYMLKAVKANPMFRYIDLQIEKYWDILIWMDKYNFGGLACTQIEDKDKQDLNAYASWKIKDSLPVIFQTEFNDWMVIILDSLTRTKQKFLESNIGTQRATQLMPIRKANCKNTGSDSEQEALFSGFTKIFDKPMIKRMNKLFRNQQEFILEPEYVQDYTFPELPGSYLPMRNPTLELIKQICQVMMLSSKTILEVRQLRKDLLKIFEIREFAKLAEFNPPTRNLVINGFMCSRCSFITDIDFCQTDFNNHNKEIRCDNCFKTFSKQLLQEHLVQNMTIEIQNYMIQDLRCAKCHKIKIDNMSKNCGCSGEWITTISATDVENKLKVYEQVGQFYEYQFLLDVLNDMKY